MRRISRRTARRTSRRIMRANQVVAANKEGTAVKMSPDDAKKVEAAGGKPVEQMTNAEMDAACSKTGVQLQECDEEDMKALES